MNKQQAATYHLEHYIDGRFVPAVSGRRLEVMNPSTARPLGSVPRGDADDVDRAATAAHKAFRQGWRLMKPSERSGLLFRCVDALRAHVEELALIESLDTGKPLRNARGEVLRAARYFEYYAGAADKFLGNTQPMEREYLDLTLLEPLGATAHVLPWNFPLLIFARSTAPALATGNTVVVKPAEQAPLSTLRAAALLTEAGIPPGVINVITGLGEEAGAALVRHPLVRGVAFTGSVETGKRILAMAAERIIPAVPELGGKSPNLVFADADLDLAVENAYNAIFANAGQTCLAGSRLLVERSIKEEMLDRLATRLAAVRLGAGVDDPDMGPLITEEQRRRVLGYLNDGCSQGARLLCGGKQPAELPGYFLEPAIFDEVKPEMRIAREEIFGPVLCVFAFDEEEEALALANDTEYGLAAGVFSNDLGRVMRLVREIDAGRIFVNQYPCGDVSIPFGGNRQSGYGRAGGMEALRHFVQVKSVTLRY